MSWERSSLYYISLAGRTGFFSFSFFLSPLVGTIYVKPTLSQIKKKKCVHTPGLPTPGHPEARSVARGDPPEGEAVRRPCGPEEDGVVRASHWRGNLGEAIEEEEEDNRFCQ